MENLIITATTKTPGISMDTQNGILEIKGRSIPENSVEFYKPVIDKINEYQGSINSFTANIFLEYFNTSSSKCLLDIFKKLENFQKGGKTVIVNWHYEEDDEDMQEAGEDYKAILELPFNISQISN